MTDPSKLYMALCKDGHPCLQYPLDSYFTTHDLSQYCALSTALSVFSTPKNYQATLSHPEWKKVIEEMNALVNSGTWELTTLPTRNTSSV